MTFLRTPTESPLYPPDEAQYGYVPHFTKVFALQPAAYAAWQALNRSVKSATDLRRYELVTLAAARALDSRYCSLAHATVLQDKLFSTAALRMVVADYRAAGLPDEEVAMMDFAGLVARDPNAVTAADVERLRGHGFTDAEIFEIVLIVCARRFFSGVLSAVGAEPDPYDGLDPEVRSMLSN
jgi:uncharacterized peroxidase-related enzyme